MCGIKRGVHCKILLIYTHVLSYICYLSKYMCPFSFSSKESVNNFIFIYLYLACPYLCMFEYVDFDNEPYVFKSLFTNKVLFCSVLYTLVGNLKFRVSEDGFFMTRIGAKTPDQTI